LINLLAKLGSDLAHAETAMDKIALRIQGPASIMRICTYEGAWLFISHSKRFIHRNIENYFLTIRGLIKLWVESLEKMRKSGLN
jgi:hypothetical protein